MLERFFIDKIGISIVNQSKALETLEQALLSRQINYICVTNSRTCYIANRNDDYCHIQNNSLMTLPDGMPLVWLAHLKGYKEVGRVSGADLFNSILNISLQKKYSHYFYGSTPSTLCSMGEKLKKMYPGIDIKGMISPPFQSIQEFKIEEIAKEINALMPTFFWCGLGAPKQEMLIAQLQPRLTHTICIGIGLVFDYCAGNVKRAPLWMHNLGLEGVYRILQQPARLKPKNLIPMMSILPVLVKANFNKLVYGKPS